MDKINLLKQKIDGFIHLHNELTHLYGQLKPSELAPYLNKEDFHKLRELIILGEERYYFFETLLCSNIDLAKEILGCVLSWRIRFARYQIRRLRI